MKKLIFLYSLRKFITNNQFKRSIITLIGVATVGSLMIVTLVAWGGITAFKTISTIGTNPIVQDNIANIETGIQNMPSLADVGCWTTVKNHLNMDIWLNKPVVENFNNVKSACLNK